LRYGTKFNDVLDDELIDEQRIEIGEEGVKVLLAYRKRLNRMVEPFWIPAFAGMTGYFIFS